MLKLGSKKRVIVSKDVDLEPYTTLKRGEKGTVVSLEKDDDGIVSADILMDRHHSGLAMWDNEAHIAGPELDALTFTERTRLANLCASATIAVVGTAMFVGVAAAEVLDIVSGDALEQLFRWII